LNSVKKAFGIGVALLCVYALLLHFIWGQYQLLEMTCLLIAATLGCLSLLKFNPAGAVLAPARDDGDPKAWPGILYGLSGLVCAWLAFKDGQAGLIGPMLIWIFLSAVVWRITRLEPLPPLPGPARALLLLCLFVLAACYRLHLAGSVPVGVAGEDEPAIWEWAWRYFDGLRTTYVPYTNGGADGVIPQYMIMLGLKAFGSGILGFRSMGILCGILMAGIFYRLGKETLGPWAGLAAGFLWAVSLWPVTVSRANYYMSETLFFVTGSMALLAVALARGGTWRFVSAGCLWAFCFNVYPAARVMLVLIPWLYVLLWMFRRDDRPALARSTAPLALGFAVGLLPVLEWLAADYPSSIRDYFAAFSADNEGGILASPSLLGKIDETLARVVAAFPGDFQMLVQHPRWNLSPHYFPFQYPIIHPWLFALAILGAAMALARFRNAFYPFLLFWWCIGLLPSLASNPSSSNDRRAIMVLPPTLLLAAVGADTLARLIRILLGKARLAAAVLLVAGLAAAAVYADVSWQDYFDRNQRDAALLVNGRAAYTELFRTIHSLAPEGGGILISTWRGENGNWFYPADDGPLGVQFAAMERGLNLYYYQKTGDGFDKGGFGAALQWASFAGRQTLTDPSAAQTQADVLVLLMPFYDYLEPGIKDLGGELVAELPVPESSDGPLAFMGMAWDPSHLARIYRIPDLSQAKVDAYAKRPRFKMVLTELSPPRPWTREQVRALDPADKRYRQLTASILQRRGWAPGRSVEYTLDDPWFWQMFGVVPGDGITTPYDFKEFAVMDVDKDGDYAFGASSSIATRIRIDQKTVFDRDPLDPAQQVKPDMSRPGPNLLWLGDEAERSGFLGPQLHLGKGRHVLEIDQAMMNSYPYSSHILRVLWSPLGGPMQTLPLEILQPLQGHPIHPGAP
jgi:4-amino-4-deoxy-L-arabinose transferase-like glycosyltransferase